MIPFFQSRKNRLGSVALIIGIVMAFPLHATYTEWTLFTVAVLTGMGFSMQSDKIIERKNDKVS